MLTTHGNPPVATALPIAAAPVATAVVMTHFVVARGGPPVGKFSCCNQDIAKIVTRICFNFVDTPAFTSALSAFVNCLFCLAIFVLQHCLHRDSSLIAYIAHIAYIAYIPYIAHRCQNSLNCCRTS